jgi:hypothetical protein
MTWLQHIHQQTFSCTVSLSACIGHALAGVGADGSGLALNPPPILMGDELSDTTGVGMPSAQNPLRLGPVENHADPAGGEALLPVSLPVRLSDLDLLS